jgi:hypothetical protein
MHIHNHYDDADDGDDDAAMMIMLVGISITGSQ